MSRCTDAFWLSGVVRAAIIDWMMGAHKIQSANDLDVNADFAAHNMNWADFDHLCDDIPDTVTDSINKALSAEHCTPFAGLHDVQWRIDHRDKLVHEFITAVVDKIRHPGHGGVI